VTVGSVKLSYAFMAARARLLIRPKTSKKINIAAGCVMVASGLFLVIKT
jgi:threonine/homoserine/homoserine lactone efflux protein